MDATGIEWKGYIFKFLSRQSQGVPRAEAESLRPKSAKKELLLQGMEYRGRERERNIKAQCFRGVNPRLSTLLHEGPLLSNLNECR